MAIPTEAIAGGPGVVRCNPVRHDRICRRLRLGHNIQGQYQRQRFRCSKEFCWRCRWRQSVRESASSGSTCTARLPPAEMTIGAPYSRSTPTALVTLFYGPLLGMEAVRAPAGIVRDNALWDDNWGGGVLFQLNTDGTGFTVLKSFNEVTDGRCPRALVLSQGALYGEISSIPNLPFDGSLYGFALPTAAPVIVLAPQSQVLEVGSSLP